MMDAHVYWCSPNATTSYPSSHLFIYRIIYIAFSYPLIWIFISLSRWLLVVRKQQPHGIYLSSHPLRVRCQERRMSTRFAEEVLHPRRESCSSAPYSYLFLKFYLSKKIIICKSRDRNSKSPKKICLPLKVGSEK